MDESEPTLNTTAFLFGNINSKGQLESEDDEMVCLNKLSDCHLEEINSTIQSLFSQPETTIDNVPITFPDKDNIQTINAIDFYDETECIEEIDFNSMPDENKNKSYNQEDDYDDCILTDESLEASARMPPPSELPLTIHNRRNNHDQSSAHFLDTVSSSSSFSISGMKNDSHMSYSTTVTLGSSTVSAMTTTTTLMTMTTTLNTPLGSILPVEYANIDIQTLFPHYHADKVPRWGKLFKPFHEPKLYRALDQLKSAILNGNNGLNNNQNNNDRDQQDNGNGVGTNSDNIGSNHHQHHGNRIGNERTVPGPQFIYNSFGINMGMMPPPDRIRTNDVDLISAPAKSFADCEVAVPFRDILAPSVVAGHDGAVGSNGSGLQCCGCYGYGYGYSYGCGCGCHSSSNQNHNHHINKTTINNHNNGHSNVNISGVNSGVSDPLMIGHVQKRGSKLSDQEALMAAKRKRRREEKSKRLNESVSANGDRNEVLIGLSWRDGPASYWFDMYNVPQDANILEYKMKPALVTVAGIDESTPLPNIDLEMLNDESSKFSTWQLVHWESDIIIDPQLVKKEIIESNKKYAPHGGWIPSYKHRNMATFQDAFSGEYFGVWPASSTGTLVQRPDVSQWHSIFALENAHMCSVDWVTNIITDPRNQNAQQPYLLQLDLNNENIHFDFTNPRQTMEILTSELNGVYLSSASSLPSSSVENTTNAENLNAVVAQSSNNTDTPIKDSKQLKKLKILSKISENTESEEKLKESSIPEPVDRESFQLNKYVKDYSYQVIADQIDNKASFFFDLIESDNAETIDLQNSPLTVHGIQHSLPAIQLDPFFFPLKLDNQFLRRLHRPRISDIKKTIASLLQSQQSIKNLLETMKSEQENRHQISNLTGSGDVFFMRSITDLSASIDYLIFAEYSEEYPPLMMQTGMASRIINYFQGHPNQPVIIPQLPFGELHVSQQIPFLGQLSTNQIFQALENNMFRAPIYPHKLKSTDFLVIIKSSSICIRRVDDVFLVGQQLPLMEVPAPNSKKANTFLKDFLHVQIIRMFLQSQSDPKRIRHDEIKNIFSEQSDSALKKRLKMFAEYKKAEVGNGSGFWVLKPEFQLPTEDELIECISPEECCAYYSMMWGLLRLEDAGYNSKSLTQADPDQQDDDEEKESNLKIEDEVKAAPWHTTKTFLDAQKGKCYLELIGVTEPTGCGEGFSYSRVSAKASLFKETLKNKFNKPTNTSGTNVPGMGKRMVTGTDADLRKLTLKKAHALLKECGIPEPEVKKLKRWDIIDLVRQMSTQKAKQGEEEGMTKFARSSRLTVADQEERYKSECQRIFNLQNQVLANEDELTTDDGANDDDDDNCDDLRKSYYNSLDNRMVINDEENDMMKIKKAMEKRPDISETNSMVDGGDCTNSKSYTCLASAEAARSILKFKPPVPKAMPKALCIRRVIDNNDGTKSNRCQTIPWSYIVKIYFKMNQEHNAEYLRAFCGMNQTQEEEKKARKKQQDKIRRLNKLQKASNNNIEQNSAIKNKYRPKIANVQLKSKMHTSESLANINCGACGKKGHMRTNKECPLYGKPVKKVFNKRSYHRPNVSKTKTIFQLINSTKQSKSSSNTIAPPNSHSSMDHNQRQSHSNESDFGLSGAPDGHDDYHENIQDHLMNSLETNGALNDDDSSVALKLVIPKQLIPQYSGPNNSQMSSQENNRNSRLKSGGRKGGVIGSVTNDDSTVQLTSRKQTSSSSNRRVLGKSTSKVFSGGLMTNSKQNEYIVEQKMKGNRRRIDPRVALNHQFEEIYKGLMQVPGYRCFLHPVRKRECPNYYAIIDNPMNLSTVKMRINSNYYETRESFLQDIKLIYNNCIMFNGDNHDYSNIAKQLMSHVMEQFCAKERKLMRLERLVNPLMDEDDMVGMRFILEQTVTAMEEVENARPFHQPVDKKKYPDYCERISRPMDLLTLRTNIKSDKYRSRDDFLDDANLILTNCIVYNGESNLLTQVARRMLETANQKFDENEATLISLETNLKMQFYDEDASADSQMAPSSCRTDHLSHLGDESMQLVMEPHKELSQHDDGIIDSNQRQHQPPPSKMRRLSGSDNIKWNTPLERERDRNRNRDRDEIDEEEDEEGMVEEEIEIEEQQDQELMMDHEEELEQREQDEEQHDEVDYDDDDVEGDFNVGRRRQIMVDYGGNDGDIDDDDYHHRGGGDMDEQNRYRDGNDENNKDKINRRRRSSSIIRVDGGSSEDDGAVGGKDHQREFYMEHEEEEEEEDDEGNEELDLEEEQEQEEEEEEEDVANRERILADLHLTDSDDDINVVDNHIVRRNDDNNNFSESDGAGGPQNTGRLMGNRLLVVDRSHDQSNSSDGGEGGVGGGRGRGRADLCYNLSSDKFNHYYYENSEHNSGSQHSQSDVKFYISDGD